MKSIALIPVCFLLLPLWSGDILAKEAQEGRKVLGNDVHAERIARIRASQSAGRVTSLSFSPNGETLVSGVMAKMPDGTWEYSIRLWDLATTSEIWKIEGHEHIITALAFSPNGKVLASASYDGTIKLWDVKTGKQIRRFEPAAGNECLWVGFSFDGETVGGGSKDSRGKGQPTISLWDIATGELRNKIEADSVVFLPEGRSLACRLTYASIRVWEIHSNREIWKYAGTSSRTMRTRKTDQSETKWASRYCGVGAVFSPEGNCLATMGIDQSRRGSENILRVWDLDTGKERFKVQGHMSDVSPIAFSQEGGMLACGTYGKGIVLRQTATGKEILTLPSQEEYVECMGFSPDDTYLAAGTSGVGTILIWRLSGQRVSGNAEPPAEH